MSQCHGENVAVLFNYEKVIFIIIGTSNYDVPLLCCPKQHASSTDVQGKIEGFTGLPR